MSHVGAQMLKHWPYQAMAISGHGVMEISGNWGEVEVKVVSRPHLLLNCPIRMFVKYFVVPSSL